MTTKLTEKEYKETMTGKMVDVTSTAQPIVDIWPYVGQLTKDNEVLDYVYQNQLVETVYRNDKETFDHILLPTDNTNIFIAIIVDIGQRKIKGHFRLDLNDDYGLN
jgi:hypothetical protein